MTMLFRRLLINNNLRYLCSMLFVIGLWSLLVGCAQVQDSHADQQQAAQINLQLALHYMHKKDMSRAKRKLELAHEQNPDNVDILMMLAYWYQQQHQADLAQKWYHKALDLHPHNLDLINNYSDFLCEQQQYQQSVKGFIYVAKHRHNSKAVGHAYQNAGLCSLKSSRSDKARHYFRQALKANPNLLISQRELTQ